VTYIHVQIVALMGQFALARRIPTVQHTPVASDGGRVERDRKPLHEPVE
jgi:hypothetical protein